MSNDLYVWFYVLTTDNVPNRDFLLALCEKLIARYERNPAMCPAFAKRFGKSLVAYLSALERKKDTSVPLSNLRDLNSLIPSE